MAKRKNGFDTTMLAKYADELESLGGSAAVKRAVEGGMKATKQKVNSQVSTAMQPGNLPAGGIYSTGATMAKLNTDFTVEWDGNMARLKLGFDLIGDGLASIFLMYGTPKMQPAAGLREALQENPRKISRKEMQAAIKKILERAAK
jgi:hypothetical protein